MKLRPSLRVVRLGLLAALGLPLACSSDDDGDSGTIRPCTGSTPLSNDDALEQCTEGPIHRVKQAQCQSELPRSQTCDSSQTTTSSCVQDTDCIERAHGHCGIQGQILVCDCQYGCVKDSDCGSGQICVCGSPVGRCVSAQCQTDADCAGGALCVQTRLEKCGATGFACQTTSDACSTDGDCDSSELCTLQNGKRMCLPNDCPVPGRPFLVADEVRRAPVALRADWSDTVHVSAGALDEIEREQIVQHWLEAGRMEHASVAAFARFALQLLSVGAPRELVEDAQSAMADETRHAAVCFGVASHFAGRALGPGALPLEGAFAEQDIVEIVRLTFREGCVGETAAAFEARQCAEHAADTELRTQLERIADDEHRHALLAWKFVRWALDELGAPVRRVLGEEVARLAAEPELHETSEDVGSLAAWGVLREDTRLAMRSSVVRQVVLPCARALLWAEAEPSIVSL